MGVYFIGIDAGGSSTRAVLMSTDGKTLRQACVKRAANPHVNGMHSAILAVQSVILELMSPSISLALPPNTIILTVALSGGDDISVTTEFRDALVGTLDFLKATVHVDVVHDVYGPAALGLFLGREKKEEKEKEKECAIVIAGTGSVAGRFQLEYAIDNGKKSQSISVRQIQRAGGRGPKFGDQGSAYGIATDALSQALLIYDDMINVEMKQNEKDKRKEDAWTLLTSIYASCCCPNSNDTIVDAEQQQLTTTNDKLINTLVATLHGDSFSSDKIAALSSSKLVKLASLGNCIALEAFHNAATHFVTLARAIWKKDAILIFSGGVMQACESVPGFRERIVKGLRESGNAEKGKIFRVMDDNAGAVGVTVLSAWKHGVKLDNAEWKNTVNEVVAEF